MRIWQQTIKESVCFCHLFGNIQAIIEGIKLLKDSKFMNYNEVVYNSVEDHCQQNDEYNLDETPPPLPPRTHSLLPMAGSGADGSVRLNLGSGGINSHGKPLPKIPASVSFNDDLYAPDNDKTNKDALNNVINNEKNSDTAKPSPLVENSNDTWIVPVKGGGMLCNRNVPAFNFAIMQYKLKRVH